MGILDIAIIIFIVMESLNICVLYTIPGSKIGNGVGVFNGWHRVKNDENSKLFTKYLVNWVANTKLIFILLLIVILFTGTETTKMYAVCAMIVSIAAYFITLRPIIEKLDSRGEITPKGYSKTLNYMIVAFVVMFAFALIAHFIV